MLAGIVLSAVLAGSASLAFSVVAGHPLLVTLLFYSLSGCCGVLAFSLQAMSNLDHRS